MLINPFQKSISMSLEKSRAIIAAGGVFKALHK